MEYIKQNTSGLYLKMQQIGCFFRSACHMAELATGKALTKAQLNRLWDQAIAFGYLDDDYNLKNSAAMANKALIMLGSTGKFTEVGLFVNGVTSYYPAVSPEKRRIDYLIQKISQPGLSKTHFRNVNNDGSLLWDPHDPVITVSGIYYSILYCFDEGK